MAHSPSYTYITIVIYQNGCFIVNPVLLLIVSFALSPFSRFYFFVAFVLCFKIKCAVLIILILIFFFSFPFSFKIIKEFLIKKKISFKLKWIFVDRLIRVHKKHIEREKKTYRIDRTNIVCFFFFSHTEWW